MTRPVVSSPLALYITCSSDIPWPPRGVKRKLVLHGPRTLSVSSEESQEVSESPPSPPWNIGLREWVLNERFSLVRGSNSALSSDDLEEGEVADETEVEELVEQLRGDLEEGEIVEEANPGELGEHSEEDMSDEDEPDDSRSPPMAGLQDSPKWRPMEAQVSLVYPREPPMISSSPTEQPPTRDVSNTQVSSKRIDGVATPTYHSRIVSNSSETRLSNVQSAIPSVYQGVSKRRKVEQEDHEPLYVADVEQDDQDESGRSIIDDDNIRGSSGKGIDDVESSLRTSAEQIRKRTIAVLRARHRALI